MAVAFFSVVSPRSLSPPGVLLPVCSVTRLTAKARAANACTNRERRRLTLRHVPACTAWTIRRCRDRTRRGHAAQLLWCQRGVVRPEDACRSTDYPLYTAPRLPVCCVFLVRSHPREVRRLSARGNACTPLHPMTGWRSLPPASLTGVAMPWRALGRLQGLTLCTAPESASGVPRVASCTNKSGSDASVHREGQRVRRRAVQTPRPALRAIVALGPHGGSRPARVTMRNIEASGLLSLPTLSRRGDRVPLMVASVSRVLETPPLPATHPRFGNRC